MTGADQPALGPKVTSNSNQVGRGAHRRTLVQYHTKDVVQDLHSVFVFLRFTTTSLERSLGVWSRGHLYPPKVGGPTVPSRLLETGGEERTRR